MVIPPSIQQINCVNMSYPYIGHMPSYINSPRGRQLLEAKNDANRRVTVEQRVKVIIANSKEDKDMGITSQPNTQCRVHKRTFPQTIMRRQQTNS